MNNFFKKEFHLPQLFFSLSNKEKMLFARDMEVMISSGMQLIQSLEILKRQARSRAFIKILDQLIMDVKNGHYLSAGLERYKNIFGDFFINLVRVGEASGTLAENFKYLAEELKKKGELRAKVQGAMAYPVIILAATMGITSVLMFFIFPRVLPIFKSLGVALPFITRAFIAIAEFLLKYGPHLIVLLLLGFIGFRLTLKWGKFKLLWHKTILGIPFVKDLSKQINIISFSRTLALLLKSGVKIVEAVDIAANTLSNHVYKNEFKEVAEQVRKGDPMSKEFLANRKLFPAIFSEMIAVGENTGKLDETALFLADFYENEIDESTKTLSTVLEPILLIAMGLIVGFVALAIITPIYQITQKLGR